jgi:hypothetical protein
MTTVITDVPAAVAGISAAELAAMRDAASAFRRQFAGGRAAADPFAALAEPFSPPPPDNRAAWMSHAGSPHRCF